MVSLISMFSIKDREETFSSDEEFETINLLSNIAIKKYKKKYRHIRFGVTQAGLEPLTTSGLDYPMLTAIGDNRLICHKDPSLVTIQTNNGNGPIYFNCCPYYSVGINDPWKKIQVHIRELSRNFAFTLGVYFKF